METRHLLAVTKIAHGLYGAIVFRIFDSRSGNQPQARPTREHSSPGKHFGRLSRTPNEISMPEYLLSGEYYLRRIPAFAEVLGCLALAG